WTRLAVERGGMRRRASTLIRRARAVALRQLLRADGRHELSDLLGAGDRANVAEARLRQEVLHFVSLVEGESVASVGKLLRGGTRVEREHESAAVLERATQLPERHQRL